MFRNQNKINELFNLQILEIIKAFLKKQRNGVK